MWNTWFVKVVSRCSLRSHLGGNLYSHPAFWVIERLIYSPEAKKKLYTKSWKSGLHFKRNSPNQKIPPVVAHTTHGVQIMCSGRSCGKSVWLKHPGKPQFLLGELRVCLEGMRDSKLPMQYVYLQLCTTCET
ncbi:uncharacterized protein LOC143693770 [Agelaius phoeniceus]|uniref:uncharacterized protein LOC143693770 n=1 Tax=Agelaius phoeniceus TaxID=39638 RepID=UPI0040551299